MLTQKCMLYSTQLCGHIQGWHSLTPTDREYGMKRKRKKSVQFATNGIGSIQHKMMAILSGANSSILCLCVIARATCNAWITHIRRQLLRAASLIFLSFIFTVITVIISLSISRVYSRSSRRQLSVHRENETHHRSKTRCASSTALAILFQCELPFFVSIEALYTVKHHCKHY